MSLLAHSKGGRPFYITEALKRLKRRPEEAGCGPTNSDLREIILGKLATNAELKTLFTYHSGDLLEIAAAIYFGQRRQERISTVFDNLNRDRRALKQARYRYRSGKGDEWTVLRWELCVKERANELRILTQYSPGLHIEKSKNLMGRRHDIPTKMVHLALERYFAITYPDIPRSQRSKWIRNILKPSCIDHLLDGPSVDAFRMRRTRLRKQSALIPS